MVIPFFFCIQAVFFVAQNEQSCLAVASRWAEIVFCLSLLHFGEIDKDDTSEDDTSEV